MDSCLRIDLCFHNIHACVVPSHKRICGRESLIPAFMWESWEYCGCVWPTPTTTLLCVRKCGFCHFKRVGDHIRGVFAAFMTLLLKEPLNHKWPWPFLFPWSWNLAFEREVWMLFIQPFLSIFLPNRSFSDIFEGVCVFGRRQSWRSQRPTCRGSLCEWRRWRRSGTSTSEGQRVLEYRGRDGEYRRVLRLGIPGLGYMDVGWATLR